MTQRRHPLRIGILFSLFATAYMPLFLLIIINQIANQANTFVWPGWNRGLFFLAWEYALSLVLALVCIAGIIGLALSLKNMTAYTSGGHDSRIVAVKNKNSETIGYIGTYILPFLFEDFSKPSVMISLAVLLVLIFLIYINSTAILINPILSIWYSLYEVEFTSDRKRADGIVVQKTGLLLIKQRHLQEEDWIKIDRIVNQLYFGVMHDDQESNAGSSG